jgi:CubicO group peptidase (beta-lactamase class C family)
MTRRLCTLLAAALAATGLPSAASAEPAALDAAVTALNSSGFSGQVMAGDADRILFDRTVGLAAAPDRWIWGSVSKQVTAALVMAEVDRGTLSLDDSVGARLPEFRDPQGRRATIRQLLQHTSGLANPNAGTPDGAIPPFYLRRGGQVGGIADALGPCAGAPAGPPGRFSYNNCDTIVAGAILERVTGRTFAQLLADRIAAPLGMRNVRLARSGERLPVGASQATPTPMNIATYGPSAAILGSAADLMRFSQALMTGRLLSGAARAEMWRGDPALGYAALGAWSFSAPLRGCQGAVRLIERRGSVDGVQARNIIAPDLGRILIVFTPNPDFDFGEIWQGRGPSHDLASAAFCPAPSS